MTLHPVAIFDLDSTLLDGDCEMLWCDFMGHRGMVEAGFSKKIEYYIDEYEAGRLDYVELESYLLRPLAHYSARAVNQLITGFLTGLQTLFRPYMLRLVDEHRSRGDVLLLATASNSLLTQPIAKMLGIPNLICTWVEMNDGVPTGKLVGSASFRDGKATTVKKWIEENPVTLDDSWGYSDSYNDLPILNLVAHPVAVTPDALLRQHAEQNGWQIIEKPD
jgi:HAD superfamily hydrolase (TIGR01490 family)